MGICSVNLLWQTNVYPPKHEKYRNTQKYNYTWLLHTKHRQRSSYSVRIWQKEHWAVKKFTLQCNYSSDLSTATGKIKNWDIFSDFFFYELLEKVRVQILISKFWEKNTEKNLKSEIKVWTLSYETCSQNSENSNLTFFSFWK